MGFHLVSYGLCLSFYAAAKCGILFNGTSLWATASVDVMIWLGNQNLGIWYCKSWVPGDIKKRHKSVSLCPVHYVACYYGERDLNMSIINLIPAPLLLDLGDTHNSAHIFKLY